MRTLILRVVATAFHVLMYSVAAHSEVNVTTEFKQNLSDAGLMFNMPSYYTDTSITPNEHMSYELAVRSPLNDLEIRYSVRPTITSLPKGSANLVENMPQAYFATVLLNVSSNGAFGVLPPYQQFDLNAVRAEFNADWGATSAFQPKPEFGGRYDSCLVVYVHRRGRGDAFIFYLYNKSEIAIINEEITSVFHSIQFR